MKKLMLVCLLGACAAATAQTEVAKREAGVAAREDAKRDEDDARTRAKLDEARKRLDEAAREVAELSTQLGERDRRDILFFRDGVPEANVARRAVLGVQIDPKSGKDGARVQGVSPGGPAADAGIEKGDVIVSIDGKSVAGSNNSYRALVEQMRAVKPDHKVKVRVVRSGKNKDLVVVTRPMHMHTQVIRRLDRGEHDPALMMRDAMPGMHVGGMPMMHEMRGFFHGEFGGMELASLTPKLGAYFGAGEGVLVVQAPENGAFKLEDGDVIQSIDGRKPDDGAHALRILRSYKSGEKLNLNVLRQRKPLTLAITMPERQEFMHSTMPPMGLPVPAPPPSSATAPVPASPGTFE
jgi:S1-C subfamily serine protease